MRNLVYFAFFGILFFIGCEEEAEPEDCAGIEGGVSVCGCTDTLATNYDSLATFDDGSCQTPSEYCASPEADTTLCGCTDSLATNYSELAIYDNGNCEYPSEEDIAAAIELSNDANTELENIISAINELDEPDIDSYNFTSVYDLYDQALALDPDNLDANFGIAFAGLMQILQDPSFENMMDNWNDYFDETELFADDGTVGRFIGKEGFGLPLSIESMNVPFRPIINMPLRLGQMSLDYVPQFSELQNIIRDVLLPYIDAGINGLAKVEQNQDYVFTVSSDMQPDVGATALEMDLTEIYMVDMMLHAIKALSNMILGHKFDFITHDADGILTELNRGSSFGTLGSTGASELAEAHNAMQNAINKLEMAINFLENETDDQSNDIIVQLDYPSDYQDVRDGIAEVKDAITQPTWVTYTKYDEYYDEYYDEWLEEEEEDSVQIDISKFFTNPIQDLKELVPPYSISVGTEYDWDWLDGITNNWDEEDFDSVSFVLDTTGIQSGDVYFEYRVEYYPNGVTEEDIWYEVNGEESDFVIPQEIIDAVQNKLDSLKGLYDGSSHSIGLMVYWSCGQWWNYNQCDSESLLSGTNAGIEWWIDEVEFEGAWSYPIITWDADNYQSWKSGWSNPTVNGIFPNWTVDDFFDFIGLDDEDMEDEWEKVWD